MKKYLLVIVLFAFVLVGGCKKVDVTHVDINAIADLPTLQSVITQVSDEMNQGIITMDQAQNLVDKLQQKYVDLTDTTDTDIEATFDVIQQAFDTQAITLYSLPLWARKLGMTEPQGMEFNKELSKQEYANDNIYGSTILAYKGNYTIALQQAQIIAQKAKLYVSKEFAQAQALAKIGDIDYISGLDIGSLSKGIVYVNHELLDTNVDEFLSVHVDQNGILTIEATKYKN